MSGHEFALPDELGWKCNDEISDYIDKWRDKVLKNSKKLDGTGHWQHGLWEVSKAELTDDIYTIIKKYQNAKTK